MGQPKLLLPSGDTTVVEQTIAAWRASRVSRVIVTLHPGDVELRAIVERTGVDLVTADPPPADMKASVAYALEHVAKHYQPDAADVWLLAPADLPTLSAAAIDRLIAAHDCECPRILVAAHEHRRGHPVLFPWSFSAEVERLPADEGINSLLQQSSTDLIECGPTALAPDLDTPQDYQQLRGGGARGQRPGARD